MITINNYINGSYCAPKKNVYLDTLSPSDGSIYAKLASSNFEDVEQAVNAAENAFKSWGKTSLEARFIILNKIADLIEENIVELAHAESLDNGKPISLAKTVDIPRAASNFRFFATGIMHFASESHEMPNTAINYTLRRPIGVVGCISPWNLPLYLFTWKIAPALAAGNCVVAKPSEVTPYTAFLLGEICSKAGLPAGVLNIIHGTGEEVGNAITVHPKIKAISFTGGTSTGAQIASKAAPMFKKLSLELGGKNPTLIFNDCNYKSTLDTVVRSSFSNQGQICLCSSRILVQQEIYEQFKQDFVDKVKALKVGHPSKNDTNIGAVVSKAHYEKIKQYISLAKAEGGVLLCGGNPVTVEGYENGYYLEPTVFEGLSNRCKTNQEEVFGPLVTLQPFSNKEEAISLANDSTYGLAASIHTKSLDLATCLANELNFGIIWVNCWLLRDLRTPFGGIKSSGVGREGGWEALRFFTEPKNICIKY